MTTLTTLDWTVLGVYLVAIVGYGVWMGRGNRKIADFFLAGREMKWWAAGLSVMATQISAITFVGTTGQAYTNGMSFLVLYFGLPFAMVALCLTLVPFFYRSGVFTAYQYLEKRFDSRTRTLTSLLFLVSRGLAMGVTLYAPSLVLSVILGWSEHATILLMGGTTILYVVYGGNKSVIWTDVVQMAIIWFGIFVCVGVAIVQLPASFSLRDSLAVAQLTSHLEVMDFSTDPSRPYTVWTGVIGGTFLAMSYFGADQSQVQRYLSGSSLTESRLALLFNAFLKVPMQFLILLTGVLVFVFYHFALPPLLWNAVEARRVEQSLPPKTSPHSASGSRLPTTIVKSRLPITPARAATSHAAPTWTPRHVSLPPMRTRREKPRTSPANPTTTPTTSSPPTWSRTFPAASPAS